MLHGEQYLEIVGDLRNEGTLSTTGAVVDVIDKKSGAVVVTNCTNHTSNISHFQLDLSLT